VSKPPAGNYKPSDEVDYEEDANDPQDEVSETPSCFWTEDLDFSDWKELSKVMPRLLEEKNFYEAMTHNLDTFDDAVKPKYIDNLDMPNFM
jgi:hypothetical protein